MEFTYKSYSLLLGRLRENNYEFCSYHNWNIKDKCVILRHDIDYDPQKAAEMAKFENELGVVSTYFVLLTSDFYNPFSQVCSERLTQIANYGHEIGLHFDEARYPELSGNIDAIRNRIVEECKILELAIQQPVKTVSMHRPSKMILDSDLRIPGIVNSYGLEYFKGFKYLSDSRRRWREPAEEIIKSVEYNRLHILTHAFWYNKEEINIHDSIAQFVNKGSKARYVTMQENITDLGSIMNEMEVLV